jgi:hypothetical protein
MLKFSTTDQIHVSNLDRIEVSTSRTVRGAQRSQARTKYHPTILRAQFAPFAQSTLTIFSVDKVISLSPLLRAPDQSVPLDG